MKAKTTKDDSITMKKGKVIDFFDMFNEKDENEYENKDDIEIIENFTYVEKNYSLFELLYEVVSKGTNDSGFDETIRWIFDEKYYYIGFLSFLFLLYIPYHHENYTYTINESLDNDEQKFFGKLFSLLENIIINPINGIQIQIKKTQKQGKNILTTQKNISSGKKKASPYSAIPQSIKPKKPETQNNCENIRQKTIIVKKLKQKYTKYISKFIKYKSLFEQILPISQKTQTNEKKHYKKKLKKYLSKLNKLLLF